MVWKSHFTPFMFVPLSGSFSFFWILWGQVRWQNKTTGFIQYWKALEFDCLEKSLNLHKASKSASLRIQLLHIGCLWSNPPPERNFSLVGLDQRHLMWSSCICRLKKSLNCDRNPWKVLEFLNYTLPRIVESWPLSIKTLVNPRVDIRPRLKLCLKNQPPKVYPLLILKGWQIFQTQLLIRGNSMMADVSPQIQTLH